ncbi:uncharacterized protein F4822DRAFT_103323 [Hypoxylon trugodes]|uniref:uncharacterized protein n=1 Tax=Hypoxylon trugodes TaxID=326681 RepID=UPI00219A8715|nr:uncharacterized protein F4822DRAFT_103323 [Hypoxylon trugodes]KAI1382713.1 hypothetical protein F4822DRAFT_103323 [Hypoxylon trugodes]
MFWLDIVVGLSERWWLFEDDRSHALVDERHWEKTMKKSGFNEVLWSDGATPESKTVRVIGAFKRGKPNQINNAPPTEKPRQVSVETVVYKRTGGMEVHADIYYPVREEYSNKKVPIALMIHGGSHMIFSRKDIRPGLQIDSERVVVVGWSSGGQLAMSLAWTSPPRGLRPPEAILAFYCPTNYEDEWWRRPIQPIGAEDKGEKYDILEAIQEDPISDYCLVGAWEPLSDPRILTDPWCRIVLHINWKAQTLPIILGGLPSKRRADQYPDIENWNALP